MNRKVLFVSIGILIVIVGVIVYLSLLKTPRVPQQNYDSNTDAFYRDNFDPQVDFISNIKRADNLSHFAQILDKVGPEAIKGTGPFTVFAPTNTALANIDEMNDRVLMEFIRNHIVAPEYRYEDFVGMFSLRTVGNDVLNFGRNSEGVVIQGKARIVEADIQSSNGIIHVIDGRLDN